MATYNTSKPAVRDSFDDDEVSDDVDDEVFIRDGKNGFKSNDDRGAKRPLMAPRRKTKSSSGNQFHSETCKQPQCKTFCVPCCYGILALVALFGLVSLVVVVINMFPIPFDRLRIWSQSMGSREKVILPCTDLKTKVVWTKSFPQLTSEAALKLNDVNKDGILDVIVGYGTGADNMGLGEEVCVTLMLGSPPCLGGVMALDGRSGEVLWQHRTYRSVLFVDCSTDLTSDNVNDCVISGKGGVLSALSGGDGKVVWELKMPLNKEDVDVYAAQFIADVDFDLVPDILTAHSSIQAGAGQGHLVLLSGRTGSRLVQVPTPHYESIYNPPHTLVRPDGTNMLLFATGSVDTPGGLYIVPLHHLVSGNISERVQLIHEGVNDSPVLVDLNNDGTEDIVAISGDKVIAIDSLSLNQIWNSSATSAFGKLQLLNSPTAAYFNDDDVPDLLFTHMVGTSYPEYYFSQTSVVDGRSGQLLLDKPMMSSSATDTLGLSLSMSGNGNNFFLYWTAVCVGQEHTQERFSFLNNTPIRQRAKADLCRLRFNTTLDLRLYAISQHTAPPGVLLYSSEIQWKEDHNSTSSETPSQHSWPPVLPQQQQPQQETQHLNNFHHTGDSVDQLKNSHHPHSSFHRPQFDSERPLSLEDYERLQQQRRPYAEWHPQEPAYGNNQPFQSARYSNLGMYGNPQMEALPDLDPGYNSDSEDPPMFPPNALGRDEREENQSRPRRSVTNIVLPHVGSAGVLTPSLGGSTVDVVMTTHWLLAADNVNIRLPRDEQCIQDRMARIDTEKYVDLETLRTTVEAECFAHHGVSRASGDNVADNSGYLVVTRRALSCECDLVNTQAEVCTSPLAYAQQNLPQRGPSTFFKPRVTPSSTLLA